MIDIKKLHDAAEIIRAMSINNIKSFIKASNLVGRDMALGMLIYSLRDNHNDGFHPDAEDTAGWVDQTLDQEELLSVLHYSPISGHGVIYNEEFEPTHIVEVGKMYKPEDADGCHISMWMQGSDNLRVIPSGPFPFREAYKEMKRAHKEAIDAILKK